MSEDATPQDPGAEGPPQELTPEQEAQIRAQLDAEMAKVRMEDVLVQSVVSLINLAARRIAKDDERDLAQGKLGIDAVSALVDLLPDGAAEEVRSALSQIQMLYAQHAGGGDSAPQAGDQASGAPADEPPKPKSSGLWTPGP